jgi:hypothetical protein
MLSLLLPATFTMFGQSVRVVMRSHPGQVVGDRYKVIAPQIWQDTTPDSPPAIPDAVPDRVLPYFKAYRHRLHVPGLYDVLPQPGGKVPWILLDNAPINGRSGQRYPTLIAAVGCRHNGAPALLALAALAIVGAAGQVGSRA